jgi:hypothetical protein
LAAASGLAEASAPLAAKPSLTRPIRPLGSAAVTAMADTIGLAKSCCHSSALKLC